MITGISLTYDIFVLQASLKGIRDFTLNEIDVQLLRYIQKARRKLFFVIFDDESKFFSCRPISNDLKLTDRFAEPERQEIWKICCRYDVNDSYLNVFHTFPCGCFLSSLQLSLQESEECISKQAYYDIENNYIAIISMDIKCDELLINAFEKAINTPENLEIQIINNPQDYENILRVAKDLCHITIIHDSSITYATWLLFDCTRNGEVHKTKDGIKWPVIISLTIVGIIVCASMGICCYLAFRRNSRMQRQRQDSLSKQQIAGRNINELVQKRHLLMQHMKVQGKVLDQQIFITLYTEIPAHAILYRGLFAVKLAYLFYGMLKTLVCLINANNIEEKYKRKKSLIIK
uniref:Uncharacterized protein n=1 Tax=Onchocerca volvulus TaxID=6282 RepID=A0A8R1XY16_ONCVO